MTGPTREEVERHHHWAVTVAASGEHIITLEPECYGGRDPSSADEDAIRTAAHHLLSFIGDDTPAALRERLEAAEADAAEWKRQAIYHNKKHGESITESRAREAAAWEAGRDAVIEEASPWLHHEGAILAASLTPPTDATAALTAVKDAAKAEGLLEAVKLCKAVRDDPETSEDEAVGALECAIAIQDAARAAYARIAQEE